MATTTVSPPTNLIDQLKRDEGFREIAYKDTQGVWTIGYGHNLEAHPPFQHKCTLDEAERWLRADEMEACYWLEKHLPWTNSLDAVRLPALQNMAFELGSRLLEFHRALTFLEDKDYLNAAIEMLNSRWARQVPERAARLAKQIKAGEWQ